MAKTLIAYFSRADENYFAGAMRYVKVGNTEIAVGKIQELIDADTFKIEMKKPYSPVYMTCIDEAKKDLRTKARPELVSMPESIDEYNTIILAFKRVESCKIQAYNHCHQTGSYRRERLLSRVKRGAYQIRN